MAVSASLVKELRERTGAGMMACKRMLAETDGDIEAAVEEMRKQGMAKADKKAGRVAADGTIAIASNGNGAAIVEVNCETDFVAKGDDFQSFANEVAEIVLRDQPADVDAIMNANMASGETVDNTRREMIARIGENIAVRRFELVDGNTANYKHGERIGVVVAFSEGDESTARDVAMHVAASNPMFMDQDNVDQDVVAKEREIQIAQAQDSGKPQEIIEKMIDGRMRKWLGEITLVGQDFVKNPDITVGQLLKENNTNLKRYVRLEVGEGIEKNEMNFADEVAMQAAAAAS